MRAPAFLLLMAIAAAACGRGDAPADDEKGSAGFVLPGEDPYVSPEDSVRAAEDVERHRESVRERVERESGVKREDRPSAAPRAGNSVEERYRACISQANQAEAEVRGRLLAACENLRRQPQAESPTPLTVRPSTLHDAAASPPGRGGFVRGMRGG